MKILLLLGHPNPDSFNAALARAVREELQTLGHEVIFHDLCAEGFDPAIPARELKKGGALDATVARHCQELAAAEGIVIVHPNWWGMPPAVLKGWIDRVIRPGVAYRFVEGDSGEGVPQGLLKAKTALVINTTDTAPDREREVFGDPLERIWKDCVFGFCGVNDVRRVVYGTVCVSSPQQREQWLGDARRQAREAFAT